MYINSTIDAGNPGGTGFRVPVHPRPVPNRRTIAACLLHISSHLDPFGTKAQWTMIVFVCPSIFGDYDKIFNRLLLVMRHTQISSRFFCLSSACFLSTFSKERNLSSCSDTAFGLEGLKLRQTLEGPTGVPPGPDQELRAPLGFSLL